MYFIDEQNVFFAEISEDAGKVAGLFEHRTGCSLDIGTELFCDNVAERCFTESGRSGQENVVEGFIPANGCGNENLQILDYFFLTCEFVECLRSQRQFEIILGKPFR